MHRISLSVVVTLLSCLLLAAADGDLPDLDAIAERHRAILDSIRSGRVTYICEYTHGTDDLEEFKKYYRMELEERIEKSKAGGADDSRVTHLQRLLGNFDNLAPSIFLSGIIQQRVNCIFDKGAGVLKHDSTDLRDVGAMMSRYGVEGDVASYTENTSMRISSDTLKHLSLAGGETPPTLYIQHRDNPELVIEPLAFAGYLERIAKPASEGGDDQIESVTLTRDPENPNLLIREVLMYPETEEDYRVVKNGRGATVKLPLEQPRTIKIVTLLDESNNFRTVSQKVYHNDVLAREHTYEYSSNEALSLPAVAKQIWYRHDGSVRLTRTYRMESVDLNVEIAAAEFELDIPRETVIFDYVGSEPVMVRPEPGEEVTEGLRDVIEELAEDDEGQAALDEIEKLPAEEPEAVQEAPQNNGRGPMTAVGIAFIVIAAIIAVTLWARRRQRN